MKRVFLCTGIAAALLTACSQTEDELMQPAQQEIALSVVNQAITKTPVPDATFPTTLPIYVSAWNSVSKDYFKNVKFTATDGASPWKGGQLWPINGVTSFLAYAFNPAKGDQTTSVMDEDKAVWGNSNTDNWAKKVTFDLSTGSLCYKPVASDGTEVSDVTNATPYVDLLYANGDQKAEKDYTAVPMVFKHSGAWIVFNVSIGTGLNTSNAKLTLNNFWLSKIYTGGTLTIDNSSYAGAKASWDFTGVTAVDYKVESFPQVNGEDMTKGLALTTTNQTFGVIIPEQAQTAIKFKYTLSSTNSAFTAQTAEYECPLSRFDKWEMGKKYVYNITISFQEITITPSVTDWDTTNPAGDQPVTVQ